MDKPTVGRIVHYIAYGTPGGEFPAGAHRAAIITAITSDFAGSEAKLETMVSLAVLNPTGLFFNDRILQDETRTIPGTWHWPEREE